MRATPRAPGSAVARGMETGASCFIVAGARSRSRRRRRELPMMDRVGSTAALATIRDHPTATLLPSGRVLLVGGAAPWSGYLVTAEIYDPTSFSATGNSLKSRIYHSATLLRTGKVLVTSSASWLVACTPRPTFDEVTGSFTSTEHGRGHRTTPRPARVGQGIGRRGTNPTSGPALPSGSDPQNGTFALRAPMAGRATATPRRCSLPASALAAGLWPERHRRAPRSTIRVGAADLHAHRLDGGRSCACRGHAAAVRRVLVTRQVRPVRSLRISRLFDPASGMFSPTRLLQAKRT